ncbi:MAG: transglycosylase SLT domain-containing protein, partial [Desulfotignum sp.]
MTEIMMENNYDNVISRINPCPVSKDVSAAGHLSGQNGPEPGGFQELLHKISQAVAPDAVQPDESQLALDKQEALALYERVRLQMNESLLSLLADDDKEASPPGSSLVEGFGQMASRGTEPPQALSTIGRAASKKELSPSLSPENSPGLAETSGTANAGKPETPVSGTSTMDEIIASAAKTYGVDADLIRRVIQAESSFNPDAVSPAGARGLMQLMPATAKELGVNDAFDPRE